ncbi:MAG: hypothetical protein NTZ55_05790 [Candidatus Roizmanbacteria bacterium]|nr:hypothetical protein [Candidatus Roizmanbacteria bacterium]
MKKNIYIIITSLLFISRFFLFISTQDAGIEHDSGWYLGVARNVAERGIYASYTNTISTTERAGSSPSIHNRFSVQDKNGFIYFPAGVTVGPGYILPEAFFLKIFGSGWTQYKIWPFVGFCLLIPILFFLVLKIGSISGLIFFQLWLWFYPQILLTFSFEAFSEHIALLFLLIGFIFLERWTISKKNILYISLCGLFLGLSFQTKNIYMLGLFSPIILLFFLKKKNSLYPILIFFTFFILPTILFELYRFLSLTLQFGITAWNANNMDIKLTLLSGGSGIQSLQNRINLHFMFNKFSVWSHIGAHPLLLVLPLSIISLFSKKKKPYIYWMLFISTVIFFLWFVLFSTTGWFRHIFPAIVMGMVLISSTVGDVFSFLTNEKKPMSFVIFVLFVCGIFFSLFQNPLALPQFNLDRKELNELYKRQSPNTLQGPQFSPIFSRSDQTQIMKYVEKTIDQKRRICFYEWALVAELPPLVDRVFFPFQKCKKNDLLIIGPYQKGVYSFNKSNIQNLIGALCNDVVFTNTMYTACHIKKY